VTKTKYIFTAHQQNVEQNYNIRQKRCSQNVAKFKYLQTTLTNQNFKGKKIKRRLNSEYA